MKQIWIPRTGPPEVLSLREAPDPEPGPGQVRIRVEAAGVNFADIMARLGLYPDAPKLPAVVGYEVAGVVDAVGPEVTALAEGDRVGAMTRFGGYSDRVLVPAPMAARLPEGLGFEAAAAIPVNYLTAWVMLVHLGGLRSGERVLVHGAGGGVGQAAVQICRYKGAEIIGTASAGKHERLRQAGVAHCIDYRNQDFEAEVARITDGHGVDIALDPIGGASFAKSFRCLASLGRLYMYGVSSLAPGKKRSIPAALLGLLRMPRFKPVDMMNDNRSVAGVNMGHLWNRAADLRAMLAEIYARVAAADFAPVVDRAFPFEQAALAHHHIQDRKNFGKVVLTP